MTAAGGEQVQVSGFEFVRGEALLEKMRRFPISERERGIVSRYTAIRPVVVEGVPDAHTAWLIVDQQSFCVADYIDSSEDAAWYCWQLAAALCRLIDQTREAAGGEKCD
jgi:hypothetical protein